VALGVDIADHSLFSSGNRYVLAINRVFGVLVRSTLL
jgi:hypothetical protein